MFEKITQALVRKLPQESECMEEKQEATEQ